jgi:elongation factor 2
MITNVEKLNDIPCGNTAALLGLEQFVTKTCTVTDSKEAHGIRGMKFSVAPVV